MEIVLILLAAGDSKRFRGNKLLHLIQGKMMYEYVVDEVEQVKDLFSHRIVVTQYTDIMQALEQKGYDVVENKESFLGISNSIHLALDRVTSLYGERNPSLCFAVCDQPYLKSQTIRDLIEGFIASGKGIGCPCNEDELGNPVIFRGKYWEELMSLSGDVGGKRIVKLHMDDVYLYEVTDSKELVDVDVQEEPEI